MHRSGTVFQKWIYYYNLSCGSDSSDFIKEEVSALQEYHKRWKIIRQTLNFNSDKGEGATACC